MSALIFLVLRFLLAAVLYLFLGWAFFVLWKGIRQQGRFLASRKVPLLTLGVQPPDSPMDRRCFSRAEIMIGRDSACDCVVDDETVSSRHARLSYHHNQWWLEDLNSTNGTVLNGVRLDTPTVVISGDEFVCGKTAFTISIARSEALLST